jgi:hypothetical protein
MYSHSELIKDTTGRWVADILDMDGDVIVDIAAMSKEALKSKLEVLLSHLNR